MALTSKLGTVDSLLGNIQLAGGATIANTQVVASTLSLSQVVSVGKVLNISVANTLTLSQTERDFQSKKLVTSAITFAQVVAPHYVFKRALTSGVSFVGAAFAERIHPAKSTFTLSQLLTYDVYKGALSSFAITQAVSYNWNHSDSARNVLDLTQTLEVSAIRTLSIAQSITFGHAVNAVRVRSYSASNTFAMAQSVSLVTILNPASSLSLGQTVLSKRIMNSAFTSQFDLQQSVVVNVVFNLGVSSQLDFLHTHTRPSGLSGQRLSVPDVMITKVQRFVVYQTSSRALSLMPPEFGDGEAGTSSIVTLRTTTGLVFTYARRALARKLTYKFLIGRPKAEETRSFIRASLSTPMYMTNWKGELWYGYIVNNPFGMSPKKRRYPCDDEEIEIAVEFEGVRVH